MLSSIILIQYVLRVMNHSLFTFKTMKECQQTIRYLHPAEWRMKSNSLFCRNMNGEWHIIYSIWYLFYTIIKLYENHIIFFSF